MNKIYSLSIALLGLFTFASVAHADIAPYPNVVPGVSNGTSTLIVGGVVVVVVVLVSWLIIRAVKKRNANK